jgi:hypothetical protein
MQFLILENLYRNELNHQYEMYAYTFIVCGEMSTSTVVIMLLNSQAIAITILMQNMV